ncbi:MAG: hypothetical protein ABEH35_00145 [Haloarculaceae archaeon]
MSGRPRRAVLRLGALSLVGLAGCTTDDTPASTDGTDEQDRGASDADRQTPAASPAEETATEQSTVEETSPTATPGPTPIPPESLDGQIRPDGEPSPVEPLSCSLDEFRRHPRLFDPDELVWGQRSDDPAVALRVGKSRYSRGDTATITLTNVSDGEVETGIREKYNLEVRTTDGWQEVRGYADGTARPYMDVATGHAPGEIFEWSLQLSEERLVADHPHGEALVVCPGLPAGRYRFVYTGVAPPVAVAFDLAAE